ncbi:MAG: hypothetical protein QG650_632 [Patescibacteria group bacterium]|nr:hypothetical protein [Patescibacteria group bacterium]
MPRKNATLTVEETPVTVAKSSESCCSSDKKCCGAAGLRIWLAVFVVVLAQVVSTAFFSDRSVQKSLEAIKSFEYEQRGGKETFDLLNKAQILQIKGQLDQIKSYVENAEKDTPAKTDPSAAPTSESKTMSQEEVAAIVKDTYFKGDDAARVIALEYTDPECPFCIRQSKDNILPKLLEKFTGKVKVAHKVFRAVPHPGAEPKSLALLCAGKLGGTEAYNQYFEAMMDRSTQEKVMPVDEILPLAKELKLDAKAFASCYDSKELVKQYDAYTAEGQKYGVSGTPGTLLVDTQTGNYKLIAGAYPFESFETAVTELLK